MANRPIRDVEWLKHARVDISPPLRAISSMCFLLANMAGAPDLLPAVPAKALSASVTVGHEFPFQRCTASGANIVDCPIREKHGFFYKMFHTVPCKVCEKTPENGRRSEIRHRCVFCTAPHFSHPLSVTTGLSGASHRIHRNTAPSSSPVR